MKQGAILVILHFKDFHLEDTQVLEPRWITTAVYKIINSPILAAGHGTLALASLKEICETHPQKVWAWFTGH